MMKSKKVLATIVSVGALAGIAGVASGVASDAPKSESNDSAVAAISARQHPLAEAKGADLAQPTTIGTLRNGDTVNVVPSKDGKCVIVAGGKSVMTGDLCGTTEQIQAGTASSVLNDCTTPHGAMFISAILPDGATAGTLRWSDETPGTPVKSTAGVVWFDGTTPSEGERYPVGIQATDDSGHTVATVTLPVKGSAFCLPNR